MGVGKGERKDFLGRRLSIQAGNQITTQSRADDAPLRRVVCSHKHFSEGKGVSL